MIMGLTVLEFPKYQYGYICTSCNTLHSSFMIHMQRVGFECMNCGSDKLDRVVKNE